MMNYHISGLSDRKAVKRHLEANLQTYKLPAYITTSDGHEYYAEESNINLGAVIVIDRQFIFDPSLR